MSVRHGTGRLAGLSSGLSRAERQLQPACLVQHCRTGLSNH